MLSRMKTRGKKKYIYIDNIKNDELKESEEESVEVTYGGING